MSTEQKTLTQKLALITGEIGAIPKKKPDGSTVSYKYRSIDDVMNKLNPLLAQHEITISCSIKSHSERVREFEKTYNNKTEKKVAVTTSILLAVTFSDGISSETTEEFAASEDYGDKSSTQAMSMAYKYAIIRKFCIVTEDLIDGDGRDSSDLHTTIETPKAAPPQEPKSTLDFSALDKIVFPIELGNLVKKIADDTTLSVLDKKAWSKEIQSFAKGRGWVYDKGQNSYIQP